MLNEQCSVFNEQSMENGQWKINGKLVNLPDGGHVVNGKLSRKTPNHPTLYMGLLYQEILVLI